MPGLFISDAWRAASIFDPATGDVAQMNTLIGGETGMQQPEEITQQTTHSSYASGYRYKVQFASADWAAFALLSDFFNHDTPVQAVAAGAGKGDRNLQWYESIKIAELRKVPRALRNEGDSYFVVSLVFDGGADAAIYMNHNLLHQVNVNGITRTGWTDEDDDNIPDGYTITDITDYDFERGGEIFSGTAGTAASMVRKFAFPIHPIQFTQSIESLLEKSAAFVGFNTFAGVSVDTASDTNTDAAGRRFVQLDSQSGIYWIEAGAEFDSSEDFAVRYPVLTIDGSTKAYNVVELAPPEEVLTINWDGGSDPAITVL